jgi:hypothetical protein
LLPDLAVHDFTHRGPWGRRQVSHARSKDDGHKADNQSPEDLGESNLTVFDASEQ